LVRSAEALELESDETLWALYEQWRQLHGITRDRAEMKRRFKKFKKNARAVHELSTSRICPRRRSGCGRATRDLVFSVFAEIQEMSAEKENPLVQNNTTFLSFISIFQYTDLPSAPALTSLLICSRIIVIPDYLFLNLMCT
jgi:hypothetical protein